MTSPPQCQLDRCRGPQLQITNARTGRLLNPDDTPLGPLGSTFGDGIAITPDGRRVFVAIETSSASGDEVVAIDTATNEVTSTIRVGDLVSDLAVSSDGARLYVSSLMARTIYIVDTASAQIIDHVTLIRPIDGIAVSPDGRVLYAAVVFSSGGWELNVVDTSTLNVKRVGLGSGYRDMVASPDGARVYVATGAAGIVIVDAATLAVTYRAVTPLHPARLALMPDGNQLFMTFSDSSAPGFGVLDLETDTFTFVAAPLVPNFPLAVAPDGTRIFILQRASILAVDTATHAVTATLPGGGVGLAVTPHNECVFEVPLQDRWFAPPGGAGTITVPAPAGCTWRVQNVPDPAFITLGSPASGTGPGAVSYVVNAQPSAGAVARRGSIRIAGQAVGVVQPVPLMAIDTPLAGETVASTFTLDGWAADVDGTTWQMMSDAWYDNTGPGVDAVHVWAFPDPGSGKAPIFIGVAAYGGQRPDVGDAFGDQYRPSGFSLQVPLLPPGTYEFVVSAHSVRCDAFTKSASLVVTIPEPEMALDAPVVGAVVTLPFAVSGWAIDQANPARPGVDAVHVWAFPKTGAAPLFLGAAVYGATRPDVGAAFGPGFAASGFSLTVRQMPPGEYDIVVFAHTTLTATFTVWRSAVVAVRSTRVVIDTPGDGVVAARPLVVGGWAADFSAASGPGVDAIHVWAYPQSGAPPTFAGAAQYGRPRPDLAAAYGPDLANAGFELDVSALPDGTYLLAVWAHSSVTGRFDCVATVSVALGGPPPAR